MQKQLTWLQLNRQVGGGDRGAHLLLENFDLLFLLSSLFCCHDSCKDKSATWVARKKTPANVQNAERNHINNHSKVFMSSYGRLRAGHGHQRSTKSWKKRWKDWKWSKTPAPSPELQQKQQFTTMPGQFSSWGLTIFNRIWSSKRTSADPKPAWNDFTLLGKIQLCVSALICIFLWMCLLHYAFLNIHRAKFQCRVWIRSRDILVTLGFVFLSSFFCHGGKKNRKTKSMYRHDRTQD